MPACNCCRDGRPAPPLGCMRAKHGTERYCWLCRAALGRAFDEDVVYCADCGEWQKAFCAVEFVELVPYHGPVPANRQRVRAKLLAYDAYLSQLEAASAELLAKYGPKPKKGKK